MMFAALRQNLATAWQRLRQGNLAKLFVFEFVVVLLGVLSAQAVADWAGERAADRRAQGARQGAVGFIAESMHVAAEWDLQASCLADQMRRGDQRDPAKDDGEPGARAQPAKPVIGRVVDTGDQHARKQAV